jgi:formylglycine-generating enzyme
MNNYYYYTFIFIIFILIAACKKDSKTAETSIQETSKESEQSSKPDKPLASENEMKLVKAGDFVVGSAAHKDQFPPIPVKINAFYLDKQPVTVEEFSRFIEATGYITDAEKFGNSGVFELQNGNWVLKPGTYWLYPLGPKQGKAKKDHPVTHISWNDAVTYAQWAKKRLPTEIEWEYAARSGQVENWYPWGQESKVMGQHMANVWQGNQYTKQGGDGFEYTSPVGHYDTNEWGFSDMAGNVWEWTADSYSPIIGQPIQVNPDVKVIKGGSFMYDEAGDLSYTAFFRGKNSVETSLFNMGFRCAKDVD